MHSRTRRITCRVAFLLFCLTPTLLVGAMIGVRTINHFLRLDAAGWEARLSAQLDLGVEIESALVSEAPSLGGAATILKNVRLVDPETGMLLGRTPALEILEHDGQITCRAAEVELTGAALAPFYDTLERRLLRQQRSDSPEMVLQIDSLTLPGADRRASHTLRHVECELGRDGSTARAVVQFRLAALDERPARLKIVRDRSSGEIATRYTLTTGDSPLPCPLIAEKFSQLAVLGERCQFEQGRIDALHSWQHWSVDIQGVFRHVDLDRLVTQRFPHKLSGDAVVELQSASFLHAKLTAAAGKLASESGVISSSLVEAAAAHLPLINAGARRAEDEATALQYRYRQLAIGFKIQDAELALYDGDSSSPIVLYDEAGPVLAVESGGVVPVTALVRTLAPRSRHEVAATKETAALVESLAMPAAYPVEGDQPQHYQVRLRDSATRRE